MTDKFTTMHGLAIKKAGNAAAVAALLGLEEAAVANALEAIVAAGEAMAARGAFMLTPKGQAALTSEYPARFAPLRANADFGAAYERFDTVNTELKQLMLEWQTIDVAGESVPNDHADKEYDDAIIDRLGALHERAEPVLAALTDVLPRLERYAARLEDALAKAESGEARYVSGAKIDSYHTVWFELHEDLLRILDRERHE